MQSDRMKRTAEIEALLAEEKKLHPELFPETTWVDDDSTLKELGIHIPHKNALPKGYLKLLPSDFIVEEITQEGFQTTIGKEGTSPEDTVGDTVYATLVKCGLSTLEAVEELAKIINTTKDKIQYAGIKDKDAITSQKISFRGIPKDKVASLSSPHFFLKDIHTGKGVVQKGGLKANRFSILVRLGEDINKKELVTAALQALEKVRNEGFYNFFYLQRFGTPRLNNYKWGLSILKGDYQKAIRGLIADPGLREIPFFLKKREEIISLYPDWPAILERLQEYSIIFPSEIKVAEHLVNNPTDFRGALQKIEDQIVLWVSAVASLMFNRRISSYLMAGAEPPRTLRLFLSQDRNDWLPYEEDMGGVGIFPPNFNNLRPFPRISLNHRDISTKDKAEIYRAEVTPEGIAIQFTLGKGEYATTFLSHFVTLIGGKIPEDISETPVDVKDKLGDTDIKTVLEYFQDLNILKK